MRFTITSVIAALAAVTSAATVDMVNQDSTTRTIVFTPNNGYPKIPSATLNGLETKTITFPDNWIGNWYTVSAGVADKPGMLGEVAFGAWGSKSYFDVSAIVDPNDHNGVKMLYPKSSKLPLSGCQTFPCANAYNLPDDIQTQVTTETALVCLIGNKAANTRRHGRDFITGAARE